MQLSSTIVNFYLFYDGPSDKKNQCGIFDTQVTVKAYGPLVFSQLSMYGGLHFKTF